MSKLPGLPIETDKALQEMARISLVQATTQLADFARKFASTPKMKSVRGDKALVAFADAIEANNASYLAKHAESAGSA